MSDKNEVAEILKKARAILSHEGCWTKNVFARSERGHDVDAKSTAACAFCSLGAIYRAGSDLHSEGHRVSSAQAILRESVPLGIPIPTWNDSPNTTHEDVLRVFDKAIAFATQVKAGIDVLEKFD